MVGKFLKINTFFNDTFIFAFCQVKNSEAGFFGMFQDLQDEEAVAADRPPHYGGPGGAPP